MTSAEASTNASNGLKKKAVGRKNINAGVMAHISFSSFGALFCGEGLGMRNEDRDGRNSRGRV